MTFPLPKSIADTLQFRLSDEIAAYQAALTAHARTVDKPAPSTHPLVEEIVKFYGGDYEIIDDTPPETSAQKRARLTLAVQDEAAARMAAIASPARRQLSQIDANRIMGIPVARRSVEDAARFDEIQAENDRLLAVYRHSLTLIVGIEEAADANLARWAASGWPA